MSKKKHQEENYKEKRLIRRHRRDRISFIKNATKPDPKNDIKNVPIFWARTDSSVKRDSDHN